MNLNTLTLLSLLLLLSRDGFCEESGVGGRRHHPHRSVAKRRWRPRQTRHPLRDLFYPKESGISPSRRSHVKRDAVDAGGGVVEGGETGAATLAAAAAPINPAQVFFNPAGNGVGLEPKGRSRHRYCPEIPKNLVMGHLGMGTTPRAAVNVLRLIGVPDWFVVPFLFQSAKLVTPVVL